MLDPLDFENRLFLNTLSKKRRKAFIAITMENIVFHGWRLFFWVVLFFGLWMLGLPEFFGETANILTTILFTFGIIYFFKQDILSFSFPKRRLLDNKLERQSDLPQGHISVLDDKLANPKKHETRDLWNLGQKEILHSLGSLKTPRMRSLLSRKDPSALRFIAVLIFVAGLMVSGDQWQNKIWSGLIPVAPSHVLSQDLSTSLWIKPPEYTQMSQTLLVGFNTYDTVLDIPEGSEIRIRMHSMLGNFFPPYFSNGNKTIQMSHLGEGLYGIEKTIEFGNRISITQGYIPRAHLNYNYIVDMPPEIISDSPIPDPKGNSDTSIEKTDPPVQKQNLEKNFAQRKLENEKDKPYEILTTGQIRFPLKVKDDYGVKELHMTMEISDIVEDRPLGSAASETRLIMSQPSVNFKISPVYDMTWHTWAGLPVTFAYEVEDHKGQKAKLEKIHVILPERKFEHPMAKSLIAMRKRLAWDYKGSFISISQNLETLLSATDYFQNDPVIYLAIRSASSRLFYNDKAKEDVRLQAAREVISLLWNTAIAIEDGNLSLAMRELRDAQRSLENAMRDPNFSDSEISALMHNLREKMARYFSEMQREMQKRMENGEDFPTFSAQDFGQIISPDTLSKLMEEIESALKSGDEQKAQELMSQLQRMMEMMDPSMIPQLPIDMQAMREGINELQELIERQEMLLEQTQQQAKMKRLLDGKKIISPRSMPTIQDMLKDFGMDVTPPPPTQDKSDEGRNGRKDKTVAKGTDDAVDESSLSQKHLSVDTLPNKSEQEALRYILGQLMIETAEHLDKIPETMGMAEQEMRGSENALEKNIPSKSIPHQEQAIKYLEDSQEKLSQQFKARMKQMIGVGYSGSQRYDPLGRPYGGDSDPNGKPHGSEVKIPDEAKRKRVDEIIKTLRERSGDLNRPDEELEYFRRLLRQF